MHHAAMSNHRELMVSLARMGCDPTARADGIQGATAAFVLCSQHAKTSQQLVNLLPLPHFFRDIEPSPEACLNHSKLPLPGATLRCPLRIGVESSSALSLPRSYPRSSCAGRTHRGQRLCITTYTLSAGVLTSQTGLTLLLKKAYKLGRQARAAGRSPANGNGEGQDGVAANGCAADGAAAADAHMAELLAELQAEARPE